MSRFVMCDTPGCTSQASLGDTAGWRIVDLWSLDSGGESNSCKGSVHACPACVVKIQAAFFPSPKPAEPAPAE